MLQLQLELPLPPLQLDFLLSGEGLSHHLLLILEDIKLSLTKQASVNSASQDKRWEMASHCY